MKKTQKSVNHVQKSLFSQIEEILPKQVIAAHEIADILSLSTDSVYRRMRGEKKLSIDEICKLCEHFDISVDALLNRKQNSVSFETVPFYGEELNNFFSHLETLGKTLHRYHSEKNNNILYLAAEIPFINLASFEELATFKLYGWSNSLYDYTGNYSSFCSQVKGDRLFQSYREISNLYKEIPSIEIWHPGTFDAYLSWIHFFYETGSFENKEMAIELCSQLLQFTNELQRNVENSRKEGKSEKNLSFYISDIALENNFMIIKADKLQDSYVKLFSSNGMIVHDKKYCEETEKWFLKLQKKSKLISGSSQKERHQYFQIIKNKIAQTSEKIRLAP